MGIETVVTCDRCEKKIVEEDYTTINLTLETDRGLPNLDVKKRSSRIFCVQCGDIVWTDLLKASFSSGPHSHP